jgi:hypothetical protein
VPGGASSLLPISDMSDYLNSPSKYIEIFNQIWPV